MPRGFDRYDEAALQRRLWTPARLRADALLTGWWAADDLGSISASGGNLSTWLDDSGFGNSISGSSSAAYAYPAISVASAATGALQQIAGTFPTTYDLFLIGRPLSSQSTWRTLIWNATNNHIALLQSGSSSLGVYDNAFVQVGSLTWTAGALGILRVSLISSTSVSMSRDGGAVSNVSLGTAMTLTAFPLILNASGGTQGFGTLHEMVFTPPSQSLRIAQKIEGYLAWKWKRLGVGDAVGLLPASHPFASRPPLIGD